MQQNHWICGDITAAVFLILFGFHALFPLDHSIVPILVNVGHLRGSCTAYSRGVLSYATITDPVMLFL